MSACPECSGKRVVPAAWKPCPSCVRSGELAPADLLAKARAGYSERFGQDANPEWTVKDISDRMIVAIADGMRAREPGE